MPLVSIIIPVFNGANYLDQAIDSALAQTYPNCELLVVNDGSTDGGATETVARSYENRIRYFHKENGGVASALNMGIEKMRGEYFSWLSHDDVYLPHKISVQVNFLTSLSEKNTFLFCDYIKIDASGNILESVCADHMAADSDPLKAVLFQMINGCTALIPAQELRCLGGFRNFPATQDYDLWLRLARKLSFRHIPQAVLYARQHNRQGSITSEAIAEVNKFWIQTLSSLSDDEIFRIAPTKSLFFAIMASAFSDWNFRRVQHFAWKKAPRAAWFCYYAANPRRVFKNAACFCGLLPTIARAKRLLSGTGRPEGRNE